MKLRILLIGPGFLSIPPAGWGAIESIVWAYAQYLQQFHDVQIANTQDMTEIQRIAEAFKPDVIHLHCDLYASVMSKLKAPVKLITSHDGYVGQPTKYSSAYKAAHSQIVQMSDCGICCLSERLYKYYQDEGVSTNRLEITQNGVVTEDFRFTDTPKQPDRSIYLGLITRRKNQAHFTELSDVDFAGGIRDPRFYSPRNWLGEWTRQDVYNRLTDYGNLVLLSDGEAAAALVVLEALSAGLGVVVSEAAAANLPRDKEWITIIPDSAILDIPAVASAVKKNRDISVQCRQEIKDFAVATFDWKKLLPNYQQMLFTRMTNAIKDSKDHSSTVAW